MSRENQQSGRVTLVYHADGIDAEKARDAKFNVIAAFEKLWGVSWLDSGARDLANMEVTRIFGNISSDSMQRQSLCYNRTV